MVNERCYFKVIATTCNPEGIAFISKFDVDAKKCQYSCSGYFNYGTREHFMTRHEAVEQGGLARLLKTTERRFKQNE